jgi:hypothetical protein
MKNLPLKHNVKPSVFFFIVTLFPGYAMLFNATLNTFSYIVAVSFIGGGNHQPAGSRLQTLLHNVLSSTPRHERDSNSVSCHTQCKAKCSFFLK